MHVFDWKNVWLNSVAGLNFKSNVKTDLINSLDYNCYFFCTTNSMNIINCGMIDAFQVFKHDILFSPYSQLQFSNANQQKIRTYI